ncbi:MAG: hypothetical protein ABI175_11730, partial [Polyangiales bacterium]
THNAPPIADIETPPDHEAGDPAAFTPGTQPGTETIAVFVMPNLLLGVGRFDSGQLAVEPGLSLRFERLVHAGAAYLAPTAFAITLGTGFAQFTDTRPTIFGATFAELNFRFLLKVIPTDIGMGIAAYPGASSPGTGEELSASIGGQLSLRLPLCQVRARYMTETGFEIMAGYEIPIPLFFRRSR